MLRMLVIDDQRHLMRSKGAFYGQTVDDLGSGPALRRPQDDHRPARTRGVPAAARGCLEGADVLHGPVNGRGHQFVHQLGVVTLHEIRGPAAAFQELLELLVLDACEHSRVTDLEAVEVQDRQYRAVGDRIKKLVGLPRGGKRSGLRLAVADDAGHDQARIVECGAECVAERIAEFAALMDRARRRWCHVAGDAAGERELLE